MRFFDLNIAHKSFPGTYDAVCEAANADSCFDELDYTLWSSNGYSTDGNVVWVSRTFGQILTIDHVFVQHTNIKNVALKYIDDADGGIWKNVPCAAVKSNDAKSAFFNFGAPIETSGIMVWGYNTIVANEEKEIGSIFIFNELGQLSIPTSDVNTKRVKEQDNHKLIDGKSFIFNRGKRWEIELITQAHIGQADIDLLQSLVKRDNVFYLWLNDNSESIMNQIIEPFAFKNMLKVSMLDGEVPSYYKNIWVSGMANKFKMIEAS